MATANFVLFDLIVGDRTLDAAAISAILELNPAGLQGAALAGALAAPPVIGGTTPAAVTASELTSTGAIVEKTQTVAAAGANQGAAGAIPDACSEVMVTVTASTQGVKLPTAVAGKKVRVFAAAGVGNKVYPFAGALIQGLATNAAYTLAAGKATLFIAESATKWRFQAGA